MLAELSEELGYRLNRTRWRWSEARSATRRKILVNGSPKSGTTWLRLMLAAIPGYHWVGNYAGDLDRYAAARPGNVIQGHETYHPRLAAVLAAADIRVAHVIRDPRDQTVSRLFHLRRDPDYAGREALCQMSDDEALLACIEGGDGVPGARSRTAIALSWLAEDVSAVHIRYEEMVADPVSQFCRALAYLEIDVAPALAEAVVRRYRFERLSHGRQAGQADASSHFRKGVVGDWRNYFRPIHVARFKEVAGDALITLGYERDNDW
jgi:hypothetical protein